MMGLRTLMCRWPALLALAVVSLAAPALAGDEPAAAAPPEQPVAQAPAEATPPVAAASLIIYIDPETGRPTSTPTEAQRAEVRAALAEMVNWSQEGLVEVVLPDGSVVMDTQGRFQMVLVTEVAPDGTRHDQWVSGAAAAAASPTAATTPAVPAAVAE